MRGRRSFKTPSYRRQKSWGKRRRYHTYGSGNTKRRFLKRYNTKT